MKFLERIKDQMDDPRLGNHISRKQVQIDRRALQELINHFEMLDTEARSRDPSQSLTQQLAHTIEALFHQNGKQGELVILIMMDVLKPLIEEKFKELRYGIPKGKRGILR